MSDTKSGWGWYVFPVFSSLLLAAHFSRADLKWVALLCLLLPLILLLRKRWVRRIFQFYLVMGAGIWIRRTLVLRDMRIESGEPWLRLTLILFGVAFFTLISALVMEKKRFKERYAGWGKQRGSR